METTKPTKTIAQVFEEFLDNQQGRISPKTYTKYELHSTLHPIWKGTGPITTANTTKSPRRAARLHHIRPGRRAKPTDTAGSSAISCLTKSCAARERCRLPERLRRSWRSGWPKRATSRIPPTPEEQAGEAAKDLPNAKKVLDLLDDY